MDLTEFQTRRQMIDVLLREQGWNVNNRSLVISEVDTKQSDFVAKNYKTISETLKNDLESKYADYLLLDGTGAPLTIIEAKRTCKDPRLGQKQAEEYADDIKRQTGKDVFIFLSNGYEIIFWDRERYVPRIVKGFHSQRDLERIRFQVIQGIQKGVIEVNQTIVDRTKGIESAKRVVEHLLKGNRKALVVMATGTGKTRVAMAIIDILMQKNLVQKVLFLADRKALRDQAFDEGFKKFFPNEAKEKIVAGRKPDRSKRLFASTIQTFQEIYLEKENGQFKLSPGEFDLIISDESHRSIYNKWRDVFTYFDAIDIGLTATPAELVDRDTFRFFNCLDGSPTALYSFEEAVKDGVLVDFRKSIIGAQTHFQIAGIKPADLSESEKAKLIEKGIDPEEINFEGTELEKKVAVKGTSEAIVREFMEGCLLDQTGMLPAKSIIFAISKKHARRIMEAFEALYPEYKGTLARVIVSDDPRATDLIKEFKTKSHPRIAISVDMLDTGIDVPEVCNLVFAKPVFSKIKFWQMLGRGTRSNSACTHRDWLPNGTKEFFKVFDFWNNFEYWEMHPEGVTNEPAEAITSRIFLTRLKQLAYFQNIGDEKQIAQARKQVIADIDKLPRDSVTVWEHLQDIEKAKSPDLWDNVAIDPIQFLTHKIMPLMRYQPEVNLQTAMFTFRCEQLALATLQNRKAEINRLKPLIGEMVDHLRPTLDKVKAKQDLIREVLSHGFWESVSFADSQRMIVDLAPLMPMMEKEPRETIEIDMSDAIEQRKIWILNEDTEQPHVKKYRERVEDRVKRIASSSRAIQKVQHDEVLSATDLQELTHLLFGEELTGSDESIKHFIPTNREILENFIRKVLGLYEKPDPSKRIREAFQTYIIETNKHYSADQLNFIRMIESVFADKKHITFADFWDPPFITLGNAPVPMFAEDDLNTFVSICGKLERELFAAEA